MNISRRQFLKGSAGVIGTAILAPELLLPEPTKALTLPSTSIELVRSRRFWQLDQTMTNPGGLNLGDVVVEVKADTSAFDRMIAEANRSAYERLVKGVIQPQKFMYTVWQEEYHLERSWDRYWTTQLPVLGPTRVAVEADSCDFEASELRLSTYVSDPGYFWIDIYNAVIVNWELEIGSLDPLTFIPTRDNMNSRGTYTFRIPEEFNPGPFAGSHVYTDIPEGVVLERQIQHTIVLEKYGRRMEITYEPMHL